MGEVPTVSGAAPEVPRGTISQTRRSRCPDPWGDFGILGRDLGILAISRLPNIFPAEEMVCVPRMWALTGLEDSHPHPGGL